LASAWKKLAVGALLMALLSGLALMGIAGGPRELAHIIASLDPALLAASFLILFVAEAVKAVRLVVLGWLEGVRIPLGWAMIARLVGRFFGVITPAYTGATPARATIVSAAARVGVGEAFAITTVESVYDSFLPVGVTLLLTIPLLPATWLPFLVSLFILFMWLGGLGWARTRSFERFLRKRLRSEKLLCYALRQREEFFQALRRSTRPRHIAATLTLTLAAHVVEALSILLLVAGVSGFAQAVAPEQVFRAFLALEVSHVMVMSPTPGGALLFEYGLTGILSTGAIVAWRIVYVLFSLIPGVLLLALIGPVRRGIAEVVERGVSRCS